MANTYVDYTASASQTDFAFSFPYLEDTHVVVEIDGVDKTITTDFTIPSVGLVRLNSGATAGQAVRVKRISDFATDLVNFVNGSVLNEADLDRAYQHNRYLNEEAAEGNDASMQIVGGGTDFNAANKKIVNLASPTASNDATNKDYVDTRVALNTTNLNGFESSSHTGDNTSVDFTLSFTPQVSTPEAFLVTIDGVVQKPTTAYTIDPSTPKITFTSAPPTSAVINVVAIAKSSTSADTTTIKTTGSTTSRSLADRFGDVVNVLDHGADNTGTVETSSHIQAAIDEANTGGKGVVYFPAGTYLVNTELNCAVGFPGSGLTLLGADGFQSVISCSSNIVVFRHVERFTVKRLRMVQTGGISVSAGSFSIGKNYTITATGTTDFVSIGASDNNPGTTFKATGVGTGTGTADSLGTIGAAFATPDYRVTTHSLFEDLEVHGFKFGLLWRYSTHNAVRNVRMYNVACGVRLARHADTITNIGDQTNPIAAGAWNQPAQNGWYHNQNTFDTMLFQFGEVAIWGSPHGNTFINITAQIQDQDGASNVALPVGQEGTGFFLEGGGDNTTLLKVGWQNSLINCYTEYTKQPLVIRDLRGLTIDGFFAQGGPNNGKFYNFLDAENSTLHLANCTGIEYFTYCLRATNCKVDSRTSLPGSGGILYLRNSTYVSDRLPTTGGNLKDLTDVDSDSYFNPYGVNPGLQSNIEFSFANGTTAGGQTLTLIEAMERECHYTVHVLTVRDNINPVRTAKFDVYNYGVYGGTLFNTIRADSTNDPAISVAVASNNTTLEFTITDAGNVAWNGAIQVINTRRLGSYPFIEDLTNNPPQEPGV